MDIRTQPTSTQQDTNCPCYPGGHPYKNYDLINAGKQPVTLLPGGAYFHHAHSFSMMRGGHLKIYVLGVFQVSANGDLANWSTGEADTIPAVSAKQTGMMMDLLTKQGASKIVPACTYPLTCVARMKRIYTAWRPWPVRPGPAAAAGRLIARPAAHRWQLDKKRAKCG